MKKVKARKQHYCTSLGCNRKIEKGETYEQKIEFSTIYEPEKVYCKYVERVCSKCVRDRAKNEYKKRQSILRGQRRAENCPDANFEYVWNGGWSDGVPDGGDVTKMCLGCNVRCQK